jgi:hypothetical protein
MVQAPTALERSILLATYVALLAVGVLLGVIEAFLVPQRFFGGTEGLSALLAFGGNLAVGLLGGIGTRTWAGCASPLVGWFVATAFVTAFAPGGDVIIPGSLPTDPGVVDVGMACLILGILGGGLAVALTSRYTRRSKAPTSVT